MRIGIITYWDSLDNYGQQLQCYALQKQLRNWGHDAFLIRYKPNRKVSLWYKVINYLQNPRNILNHIPIKTTQRRVSQLEKKLRKINDKNNIQRKFELFRSKNLKMSDHIYTSFEDIKAFPPEADVYITGSDQVWHNPYNELSIQGYFLQFGEKRIKRISYAASIGRDLKASEIQRFKKFLDGFNAISVREDSACRLCLKHGIKAQTCLDPTMLLSIDIYRQMAEILTCSTDEYAFIYVLNVKSNEDFYWPQIRAYLKERNLKIKSVTGSGYYQGRELIEDNVNILASIPEWLGYIISAQCIFTTSFHGTVFSILMHRPFLTIGLQGKYGYSNDRMEQLLKTLGISERIFNPMKSVKEQMEQYIDWQEVDRRIASMRQSSLDFLKNSIE